MRQLGVVSGVVSALLFTATMASCFGVDLTGATIKCTPGETGNCPDGQTCSAQGVCTAGAEGTDGGNPGSMPDMSTPVTTPMLTPTNACPSGMGYDVTAPGKPQVYACPTKYSNTQNDTADSKCMNGYMLCANANNVNQTECTKIGQANSAFFLANVEGKRSFSMGRYVLSCGTPGGQDFPAWAGCGKGTSTFSPACMGFTQEIDCSQSGTFQCKGNNIGDTINNDGASGVLCCHP
jgi:hypothetical protein